MSHDAIWLYKYMKLQFFFLVTLVRYLQINYIKLIIFYDITFLFVFFFLVNVYNCFCLAFGFNRVFIFCLFRVTKTFFLLTFNVRSLPFSFDKSLILFVFVNHFFFFQFRLLCFRSLVYHCFYLERVTLCRR